MNCLLCVDLSIEGATHGIVWWVSDRNEKNVTENDNGSAS